MKASRSQRIEAILFSCFLLISARAQAFAHPQQQKSGDFEQHKVILVLDDSCKSSKDHTFRSKSSKAVIRARCDIPEGNEIYPEDLECWEEYSMPKRAVKDYRDVVGGKSKRLIKKGEVVLTSDFIPFHAKPKPSKHAH